MPTAAEQTEIFRAASGRTSDAAPALVVDGATSRDHGAASGWSYDEAFSRNLGLISREEQQILRRSHVAIAGMGGVGGVHLLTLARLGIGRFTIADPDTFEVANSNRQAGASTATFGRGKAEVMAEQARAINPELEIEVIHDVVDTHNLDDFFAGADLFIDGVDFFSIGSRRLLFGEARRRGLWSITAGPIGFSTGWLSFDPRGMSFDRYFDLNDNQSHIDQVIAFAVGLTPRATHLRYLDLSQVNLAEKRGPSVGASCQLASGMAATEAVKILLNRGQVRAAPNYAQFDAYRGILRQGRLAFGNRHPIQRLKRKVLHRRASAAGLFAIE
jgi:molybdopterin/thiamine biosynthesis adenylyltransferase